MTARIFQVRWVKTELYIQNLNWEGKLSTGAER